jgi:RNA polymerase sigma factor (sigma-70 family)
MNILVCIIEDQKETREMLSILIGGSDGYCCVGAFESAEQAITSIPPLFPNVVLVDIQLPNQSGIECVKQLKLECPGTQFIMCTSIEDTETIFAALAAGASGYITKSTSPLKILEAITDAYQGGSPMSSQIARKVVSFFQRDEKARRNEELEKLSVREKEILELLSEGFRYKEIADKLFISIATVRKHIQNIYEKLQVNSRTDALNKVAAAR